MEIDTSFQKLLQEAGALVGFNDMEAIQDRMQQEFLTGVWQLAYLDSMQWAHLGAPVGLSIAVRHLLGSLQSDMRQSTDGMVVKASTEMIHDPFARRTVVFAENESEPPERPVKSNQLPSMMPLPPGASGRESTFSTPISAHPVDCQDDELLSKNSSLNKVFASSSSRALLRVRRFMGLVSILDLFYPFFQRRIINRAILHGKSCAEIRSFAYRKSEMLFFMSALVSGVIAEIWGGFPPQENELLPRGFHIAFHLGSMWTLGLSMGLTAVNIVMILMSCAVEVKKFKEFYRISLRFVQLIDFAMLLLVYLVLFVIFLLTYARVGVLILEVADKRTAVVCCGVVVGSFCLLMLATSYFYNEVARFIFHGGLLSKGEATLSEIPHSTTSTPREIEAYLVSGLLDNLENKTEKILCDSALALEHATSEKHEGKHRKHHNHQRKLLTKGDSSSGMMGMLGGFRAAPMDTNKLASSSFCSSVAKNSNARLVLDSVDILKVEEEKNSEKEEQKRVGSVFVGRASAEWLSEESVQANDLQMCGMGDMLEPEKAISRVQSVDVLPVKAR